MKADLIKSDIRRLDRKIIRDTLKFQTNKLSSAALMVTLESLGMLEKEFRDNSRDPHFQFTTITLERDYDSTVHGLTYE